MNTTESLELGLTDEQMNEVRQLALGSLRELAQEDLPEGTGRF